MVKLIHNINLMIVALHINNCIRQRVLLYTNN